MCSEPQLAEGHMPNLDADALHTFWWFLTHHKPGYSSRRVDWLTDHWPMAASSSCM